MNKWVFECLVQCDKSASVYLEHNVLRSVIGEGIDFTFEPYVRTQREPDRNSHLEAEDALHAG